MNYPNDCMLLNMLVCDAHPFDLNIHKFINYYKFKNKPIQILNFIDPKLPSKLKNAIFKKI